MRQSRRIRGWGAAVLVLMVLTACRHTAEDPAQVRAGRVRDAVDAVMQRLDPYKLAVILADEAEVANVRGIVSSARPVESLQRFATEHADGVLPYNILFQSAKAEGSAVLVKVHVPGFQRVPPEIHACGTGYVFEVTKVKDEWVIEPIEILVC